MVRIYLGGDVSEFHLDSGKILVLDSQEEEELLGYNAVDFKDILEKSDSYDSCIEGLSSVESGMTPEEFIFDVVGKINLFKKNNQIPSLDDILLQYEEQTDLQNDTLNKQSELIAYLSEWIKDER